jgi:hypothetical protein
MIQANLWGSVIKLCQGIITDLNGAGIYPVLLDWDTHANIQELPNSDLFGPSALAYTEAGKIIEVSFSIAVSSYATDHNMFRHREMIGRAFERVRPENKFDYYDADTAAVIGFAVIQDGTAVAPVSRAEVRPFQFVQVSALIDPSAT